MDPEERGYFVTLSDYIHLNPVRARMIALEERLDDSPWEQLSMVCRAARASGLV